MKITMLHKCNGLATSSRKYSTSRPLETENNHFWNTLVLNLHRKKHYTISSIRLATTCKIWLITESPQKWSKAMIVISTISKICTATLTKISLQFVSLSKICNLSSRASKIIWESIKTLSRNISSKSWKNKLRKRSWKILKKNGYRMLIFWLKLAIFSMLFSFLEAITTNYKILWPNIFLKKIHFFSNIWSSPISSTEIFNQQDMRPKFRCLFKWKNRQKRNFLIWFLLNLKDIRK